MSRREYLGAAAGIAAAVTAGCSGDESADLGVPKRVLRGVEFERHEAVARLTLVDDPAAVDLRIDSGVTERTVSVRARDDRIFVPINEDGGELLVEARIDEEMTTIHHEQYGRRRVVDGVYVGTQFDEFPATAEVAFTARDPESYGATLTALWGIRTDSGRSPPRCSRGLVSRPPMTRLPCPSSAATGSRTPPRTVVS